MKVSPQTAAYESAEKSRVLAFLQTTLPNGDLKYAKGIEHTDLAQHLVGINAGRTPSGEYVKLIEKICTELVADKKIAEIKA